MPSFCSVGSCTRTNQLSEEWKDCVFLHKFPNVVKEPSRHHAWVRFVNRSRKDFKVTAHSHICSKHFLDSDYENKTQFLVFACMGQKCRYVSFVCMV